MKKKNEVFVRINTPKKARKVIKVLELFKEKYMGACVIETSSHYDGLRFYDDTWCAIRCEKEHDDKTEVSIKELRNILAIEHLKESDVVVTKSGNEKIIAIYDHACKSNLALFQAKRWVRVSDGFKWNNEGCFDTFIRYATEGEKALLEGELTIADYKLGGWYKSKNGSLIYFNDTKTTYGFISDGEFYDKIEWVSEFRANGFHKPGNWVEADKLEVHNAIKKEAVSRYGKDWLNVKIKDHAEGLKFSTINDGLFQTTQIFSDRLYNKNGLIYYNGKWAEILEEPKSIEVGKWYKGIGDKLIFTTSNEQDGHVKAYGFGAMGGWFEDDNDFTWTTDELKEATKEEVEQALIKEAKKRYKVGDYLFLEMENMLFNQSTDRYVFDNGKWAEIIEPSFVESSDKIKVAGEDIGKRVRVIDGGGGATGCNGQTGIIVEKPKECLNGSLKPVIYIKLDNGHTWGLAMDHKIEYITESSPLTVTLEIKDIATLQVIQKTLKELEEKLTKLI